MRTRNFLMPLDGDDSFPVGPFCFLMGPLLITEIPAGAEVRIWDGHPAESSSTVVHRLAASAIAPGGVWVAGGAFVTATRRRKIRARFPTPHVLELHANRGAKGFTDGILRSLARINVHPIPGGAAIGGEPPRRLAVSVPVTSLPKLRQAAPVQGYTIKRASASSGRGARH